MERKDIITVCPECVITAEKVNSKLPKGIAFHSVLNPGGERRKKEEFLLIRGEDFTGHSSLVGIKLVDGGKDFDIIPSLLLLAEPGVKGYEDPRVVWSDDLNKFVIVYVTAYQNRGPVVSLMTIPEDLSSHTLIGDAIFIGDERMQKNNKDASLLPIKVKVKGRLCFGKIHRPIIDGVPKMYLSFCDNDELKEWKDHIFLAASRRGTWWDEARIGLATQPIKLPDEFSKGMPKGLLLIYHGVKNTSAGAIYRVGLMWLGLEGEPRITHRSDEWILDSDDGTSVREGNVHTVKFPCAGWFDEQSVEIVAWSGVADAEIHKDRINIQGAMEKLRYCSLD